MSVSLRAMVLGVVDVMMRVPPLFMIDELLKISMGLPSTSLSDIQGADGDGYDNYFKLNTTLEIQAAIDEDANFYKVLSLATLKFVLCFLGCLSASCIFMLWTRHLVIVYMYITSIGLIFLSYWGNVSALSYLKEGPSLIEDMLSLNTESLLNPSVFVIAIGPHLITQWLMGIIFASIHLGPRYETLQKALPISFIMPLLLATLPLPLPILKHSPAFAALLPLILSKIALWSSSFDLVKTLINGYQHARNFASDFGLSALVENEWQRLNVPCVLRAFWCIRLLENLFTIVFISQTHTTVMETMQNLLISGCETLTAVLGMTSLISMICHYIGKFFQFLLLSEEYDEDKSIGTVSAILFYILALQTGLTSLSPEKRFIRLCRNLCLLVTALLHFLHNIVAPILMSLSAARNPSRKRHARALMVCAFLLIAPVVLLTALWSRHTPSTWLLAVTAFSVEVIVKVLVSLATYTLFLLDARRQTFWEKLDDYVYYIRAFGNSVEFCFGIFLFFNGAWILVFESERNAAGGAIRALMMCIHAYFNIWCEARAGWGVFMKRRTAVHKISSLPEATAAQLLKFDDVCAICYQEMTSAKITRCKHYFHGVCLRKWLYVQDRCPLCHEIIMHNDPRPAEKEPDDVIHVDNDNIPPHYQDIANNVMNMNPLGNSTDCIQSTSTTNAATQSATASTSNTADPLLDEQFNAVTEAIDEALAIS